MAIRLNRPDWVLELLKNGASFETAKASYETAKASFEAAKDIKYDKENSVDYTEVRAEDGTAFATSTFNRYYRPEQAFKILGAGDKTYWCSKYNPVQPVSLWFQFKEPKCVTKIEFNEKYSLPSGKVYQVFASNALGNCESPSQMTIICDGTAEVFAGGKEFVNNQTFYCYGLRTYDQSARNYVAVKRLQFGVKASFETAKASLETAKASLETAKASLKTAQDIKYKQSKFEDSMELFEVYAAIWRRLFKTDGAGNGENASKLT